MVSLWMNVDAREWLLEKLYPMNVVQADDDDDDEDGLVLIWWIRKRSAVDDENNDEVCPNLDEVMHLEFKVT
jgi:hypothetical protein